MQSIPKEMKGVYRTCNICVISLIQKGHTPEEAQDIVLKELKNSEAYLVNKQYELVIQALRMVFLEQSIEKSAKNLIKSL